MANPSQQIVVNKKNHCVKCLDQSHFASSYNFLDSGACFHSRSLNLLSPTKLRNLILPSKKSLLLPLFAQSDFFYVVSLSDSQCGLLFGLWRKENFLFWGAFFLTPD